MHDDPGHPPHRPPAYGHAGAHRRPMGTTARVLWIFLAVVTVCAFATVSAIAYAAHSVLTSPFIQVHVRDHVEGHDFHVAVPSGLVAAGLTVAPWVMPDDTLDQVRHDLDRDLDELPVDVRRLAGDWVDALAAMPDATLVEVEDGTDRVWVEKRGDHLLIQVDSVDADVEVEVPIHLLHRALDFIEV